ncbi:RNA-binding cell elongation regulator Jag/EloR [Desulfitobacterium sp.]|uniref:RNA-binding cell elongation regulator Jag/EloR n=1 Tax=Desulfitobacterium sp. TaxID=49981 RepID=UPI002B2004A9|nr:RNA-binding cell elongation regulator Jag/EloR [Desulfitobacterium sp.]MEA4900257.1 RNA-binding cell elongation regulator Jag/EloR [Desulfitobacterium sp.]
MRIAEKTGKTVEDAIEACLTELGVKRENATIEVLEEPVKKGLFGLLGTSLAKVRVSYEDDPGILACQFLEEVCTAMGVQAEFNSGQKDKQRYVNITGSELGILIGRRGDTLEALQFLTNLAVSKKMSEKIRILVDVEGYRQRREDTLISLAKRLSERVKRTGNRVVLEPMNPHERRIIHTALQDDSRISTFSEGEEPHRRVIISLKKTKEIS